MTRFLLRSRRLLPLAFAGLALFLASEAPAQPVKCDTRSFVQPGMQRVAAAPVLPETRMTPSGHGVIHYATTGDDAVTEVYVDSAAAILDHVWAIEVDSLGYPAPPGSEDGRLHVYLLNLRTVYGYTVPQGSSGTGLGSYIVCDNDYLDPAFGSRGLNGLRVTLAHEFFHAIQFNLRLDPFHLYFYEWNSTWMEEVVYPQINDYFYYLPAFFGDPARSIRTMDGTREYATGILLMMIGRKWGRGTIRDFWDRFAMQDGDPFQMLQAVLDSQGVSVDSLAGTFLAWNLLVSDRAVDGFGYPDARYFPAWLKSEGEQGDLGWSEELEEWGMLGGALPGGIRGRPNVTLQAAGAAVAVVAGYGFGEVRWGSTVVNDSLMGAPAVVGAISLEEQQQTIAMSAHPEWVGAPASLVLSPAVPNPSNGIVSWSIQLDRPGRVRGEIYNILGQRVAGIDLPRQSRRTVRLSWDGRAQDGTPAASGVYILRAVSGTASGVGKAVLVR